MRRTGFLICCALALLLAGCSGPSGTLTDSSVTPVEPPTVSVATTSDDPFDGVTVVSVTPDGPTARPNATFEGVEMPPGTDRRGVVNVDTLTAANTALLAETDFVLEHNETTRTWANESVESGVAIDGTVTVSAADVARYRSRIVTQRGDNRRTRTGQGYVRNGTEYHLQNGTYTTANVTVSELRRSLSRSTLGQLIERGDWEPVETTTVHGRAAVVFEFRPQGTADTSFDGRMVVDTRGLVHELRYRIERRSGDNERRIEAATYDLDPTPGVDPEPPSWLPDATNATRGGEGAGGSTVTTVPG